MQDRIPVLNVPKYHADELLGRIHSFESFGTVDGPGTRFVVFLQGCLFRCKYCHNRDTWDLDGGDLYSVTDMVEKILPFARFMDASGGGVTVTGGEPVLQAPYVALLFEKLQQHGIHTCLDTNGYVGVYSDEVHQMIDHTDLVMLDIKHIDDHKHHLLVGVSNQRTLRFARHLADIGKKTRARYVVVPGYSDEPDDVHALAQFLAPMENIEHVELLPYHNLGTHKWKAMGLEYPLEGLQPPSTESMDEIEGIFRSYGLEIIR
ncbi:pyruvate formate-lyase-activating protein [Reinekea blandensis]|uniref:Pyruvate formate-lyase-activating enzyme n=1 Tax=Reinekea blandensis MED297 TaxID=314283 RepID=A4BFV8_9GAMM|nr:pyruvate formate-lyase-activating protein [Reinekea blandensis]EAR08976.1 pyruvate formate-lyase 1 activating enzyme [Reinekea sp. MED297] [Reinekea blandensis MED297]